MKRSIRCEKLCVRKEGREGGGGSKGMYYGFSMLGECGRRHCWGSEDPGCSTLKQGLEGVS